MVEHPELDTRHEPNGALTHRGFNERIAEASERGWLGEVDGLRTSLAAAEQKLTQMQRTATNLGIPNFPRPSSVVQG